MEIAECMSNLTLQDGDPVEQLADEVFRLTIKESKVTQAITSSNSVPPASHSGKVSDRVELFKQIGKTQITRLSRIDEDVDVRCRDVLSRLDSLASTNSAIDQEVLSFLEKEDKWLQDTRNDIKSFLATTPAAQEIRLALLERVDSMLEAVDCYNLILRNRVLNNTQGQADVYDSGK